MSQQISSPRQYFFTKAVTSFGLRMKDIKRSIFMVSNWADRRSTSRSAAVLLGAHTRICFLELVDKEKKCSMVRTMVTV